MSFELRPFPARGHIEQEHSPVIEFNFGGGKGGKRGKRRYINTQKIAQNIALDGYFAKHMQIVNTPRNTVSISEGHMTIFTLPWHSH